MKLAAAAKEIVTIKISDALLNISMHSNNIATRKAKQSQIMLKHGGYDAEAVLVAKQALGYIRCSDKLSRLALKIYTTPRKERANLQQILVIQILRAILIPKMLLTKK